MFDKQLLIFVLAISIMFVSVIVILTNNISSSNRNFGAIIESELEINHTIAAVNDTVTDLITDARESRERDANLTREETEQLVANIRAIPDTLELVVNQTAMPQSNFTAQKQAIANIEELKDDMNVIKGSILSLDNKVNELFFFENRSSTPTR